VTALLLCTVFGILAAPLVIWCCFRLARAYGDVPPLEHQVIHELKVRK